jgi:hypothetical protein
VLSSLSDFCEKEAEILRGIFKIFEHKTMINTNLRTVIKGRLNKDVFEASFVEKILEIIEFSNEKHQQNLVTICAKLQIYESRKKMLGRADSSNPDAVLMNMKEDDFLDLAVRIVELHARSSKLFPVARATRSKQVEAMSSDIDIATMNCSVRLLDFVGPYEQKLYSRIREEFQAGLQHLGDDGL